jgi:hypothetical protein
MRVDENQSEIAQVRQFGRSDRHKRRAVQALQQCQLGGGESRRELVKCAARPSGLLILLFLGGHRLFIPLPHSIGSPYGGFKKIWWNYFTQSISGIYRSIASFLSYVP